MSDASWFARFVDRADSPEGAWLRLYLVVVACWLALILVVALEWRQWS